MGQLRQQLFERFPATLASHAKPANVTIWLPSWGDAPITRRGLFQKSRATAGEFTTEAASGSSSEISTDPTVSSQRASAATFQPAVWQVTGLTLPLSVTLTTLTQLGDTDILSPTGGARNGSGRFSQHLRPGNDLLFWCNAAKFALEILVGQHYLPSLRTDAGGTLSAVWQLALLDEHLRQNFEQLVEDMPPVCRAYNLNSPADAPSPTAHLEHFLVSLVDSAVRHWGRAEPTDGLASHAGAVSNHIAPSPFQTTTSPAQQWIQRLLESENRLTLPPQPAYQLFRHWHAWMEQLHAASDANFRICLKLEEPPAATDASPLTWKLRYYLQARDNPQLLISAQRIWTTEGSTLRYGDRRIDQPQERLLAGLGAISRLFGPIERSLRSPRPEAALLSTDEAYQFLREIGPLLENSGFGVVVPQWWHERKRTRIGMRLHLSGMDAENDPWLDEPAGQRRTPDAFGEDAAASLPGGLDPRIQYTWELMLGGRKLNQEEFDRLASLRTPLVYLRDRWIELDPAQVRAANQFLNTRTRTGSMSLLQALRIAQSFGNEEEVAETEGAESAASDSSASDSSASDSSASAAATGTARRNPPEDALALSMVPDLKAIPPGLALDGVQAQGYLEKVLANLRDHARDHEVEEPEGFTGELRPYQRRGVAWLTYLRKLGLGACLADDMGLGKTIQAIALHLHVRAGRQPAADKASDAAPAERCPTLLICPTSVLANWQHEIKRFAPHLCALIHHGNNRLTGDEFAEAVGQHDFVITSYGTARRDIQMLEQRVWLDVILDEAQNIKNPGAKQTQAVRRLRAYNRMALTGTPVENRLVELWSISEFLNPGYLGGYEQFRKQFIVPIERYNDSERAAQLRRLVQPFLLRRLKTDPTIISDLPEKNEMIVYCAFSQEQRRLYERTVQEAFAKLQSSSGIQRRGLVLSLLTKLKQICNHPAQFLKENASQMDFGKFEKRSGKLSRLCEMLEEVQAAGDRALIFTQFVEMGELLRVYLNETLNTETLFLHGGTSATQRDQMVQLFQSEEGPPFFILSLRAGGYGLNLTHANHVFHFDRWWNPAVENQATDRAFRIGQQRNVQVHKFVVAGTLEERIHELIESKQQLAENIVGSGEEWLTEMDTDELRDLLTLRSDMSRTFDTE